jgi:hypothetical protein
MEETVEAEIDKIQHHVYDLASLAKQEHQQTYFRAPGGDHGPPILGFAADKEDDEPFEPAFIPPEIEVP